MKNILQKNGYKVTPARLAILQIFYKNHTPLDAETVYRKLKNRKTNSKINEVTVYRTLSAFEKTGILRRVNLKKDSACFELNNDHHHHIVCIKCHTVEIFRNSAIEKVLERIVENSLKFKKVKEHSLELFGLCVKCS
ncbi:hypothetical protein COU49_01335 [Candidatus Nomurabacteria bacterium CG10_big_fil_rev_8_21_14_0_10_35_16]|uniref:Transcriptional repressor n=1 Tax=Candidatus Nomurabacteria bacterium CG10_big_fil_rev_8_21_14_0_10_35_16 TaxID=1974731 RepID=A0A2H0TBG1_9BACT|nr:MAG: hypothetical protein COU49_01335 [Candidatus Nomurabacteria bacterium CG10_big_fil_rev_8_21_14_0_10_35_16]